MTGPLEARVRAHIKALERRRLFRALRPPSGVDFSSNDYLGLAAHSLLKRAMIEGVEREGCGSTGSRLLRGHRDSFERVERKFAAFKQTEAALYFSSGYLANLAVLTTFPTPGDRILCDERSHASIIDGVRLSRAKHLTYPHNDADALGGLLAATEGCRQTFVVTESLFSMDGDVPPLAQYAALCRAAGAVLIVDEAHAVGVYGARGSGLIEDAGLSSDDVFISVNTAGKALGVAGAFVAGPSWAIEYMIQRARSFIFSTAPPPALASALDASLTVIGAEPDRRIRLARLARFARQRLREAAIPIDDGCPHIIPVILGENDRATGVAAALLAKGFDIRAIRPPSVPPGTARLRISLNVALDEAVIGAFVEALAAQLSASPRRSTLLKDEAPNGQEQEASDAGLRTFPSRRLQKLLV